MTDEETRAFWNELQEAVKESRQQGERLDAIAEAHRFQCPDCGRLVSVEGERCVLRPEMLDTTSAGDRANTHPMPMTRQPNSTDGTEEI